MCNVRRLLFLIKTNFPRENKFSYKRTFAFETKQNFPDEAQKDLYRGRGINPFSGERHEKPFNTGFKTFNMEEFQTNLFDRRTVKKEMTKAGIKPVKRAALMIRITLTAIFFERSITDRGA